MTRMTGIAMMTRTTRTTKARMDSDSKGRTQRQDWKIINDEDGKVRVNLARAGRGQMMVPESTKSADDGKGNAGIRGPAPGKVGGSSRVYFFSCELACCPVLCATSRGGRRDRDAPCLCAVMQHQSVRQPAKAQPLLKLTRSACYYVALVVSGKATPGLGARPRESTFPAANRLASHGVALAPRNRAQCACENESATRSCPAKRSRKAQRPMSPTATCGQRKSGQSRVFWRAGLSGEEERRVGRNLPCGLYSCIFGCCYRVPISSFPSPPLCSARSGLDRSDPAHPASS